MPGRLPAGHVYTTHREMSKNITNADIKHGVSFMTIWSYGLLSIKGTSRGIELVRYFNFNDKSDGYEIIGKIFAVLDDRMYIEMTPQYGLQSVGVILYSEITSWNYLDKKMKKYNELTDHEKLLAIFAMTRICLERRDIILIHDLNTVWINHYSNLDALFTFEPYQDEHEFTVRVHKK